MFTRHDHINHLLDTHAKEGMIINTASFRSTRDSDALVLLGTEGDLGSFKTLAEGDDFTNNSCMLQEGLLNSTFRQLRIMLCTSQHVITVDGDPKSKHLPCESTRSEVLPLQGVSNGKSHGPVVRVVDQDSTVGT